jgi:hypothetical protein
MMSLDKRSGPTIEVACASWEEFKTRVHRDYIEEIMGVSTLFRGHSNNSWKLASPWDRKLEQWSRPEERRKVDRGGKSSLLDGILKNFRELSVGLPGLRHHDLDEVDWWALGRHYGLVTPFLDWTRSPYVAAFFAFTGFIEAISPGTLGGYFDPRKFMSAGMGEPVAVWGLLVDTVSIDGKEVQVVGRGEAKEIEVLNPQIDIGHRQRAQRGFFTRLSHNIFFDIETYLASLDLPDPALRKYTIPGSEAAKAITELRMMNITFATLFPDLEGAARQANFDTSAFAIMAFSMVPSNVWTAGQNYQHEGEAVAPNPGYQADG